MYIYLFGCFVVYLFVCLCLLRSSASATSLSNSCPSFVTSCIRAGTSPSDLVRAGSSSSYDLVRAGSSSSYDIVRAGASSSYDIVRAGASYDLVRAGPSSYDLVRAGASSSYDIVRAGSSTYDLVRAGSSSHDLIGAEASPFDHVRPRGSVYKHLRAWSYTNDLWTTTYDLTGAGSSPYNLVNPGTSPNHLVGWPAEVPVSSRTVCPCTPNFWLVTRTVASRFRTAASKSRTTTSRTCQAAVPLSHGWPSPAHLSCWCPSPHLLPGTADWSNGTDSWTSWDGRTRGAGGTAWAAHGGCGRLWGCGQTDRAGGWCSNDPGLSDGCCK